MSRETKEESGIAKGARRATEAGPDFRSRGKGRWSARRKVNGSAGVVAWRRS